MQPLALNINKAFHSKPAWPFHWPISPGEMLLLYLGFRFFRYNIVDKLYISNLSRLISLYTTDSQTRTLISELSITPIQEYLNTKNRGSLKQRQWKALLAFFRFQISVFKRIARVSIFLVVPLCVSILGNIFFRKISINSIICNALARTGGTFIKLGQWASTRPDLLPADLCQKLANSLQSQAPSHSFKFTSKQLEPFNQLLKGVQPFPVGSGAVAQVHMGALHNGKQVVVKVLHPQIEQTLQIDLYIMKIVGNLLHKAFPSLRWIRIPDEIQLFSNAMLSQCDLRREALNLVSFRRNFFWMRKRVTFPTPLLATKNILIESYEGGIPISRILQDPLVSHKKKDEISERLLSVFLRMVLRDNFIHADMHPGNILVSSDLERLIILDAGLVTSLKRKDFLNFSDLFKALFIYEDGERVGRLLIERLDANAKRFIRGEERFCSEVQQLIRETFHERSSNLSQLFLEKISLGSVFKKLVTSLNSHQVHLDPAFTNLVMSIICVEGLGRQLSIGKNLLPLVQQTAKRIFGEP